MPRPSHLLLAVLAVGLLTVGCARQPSTMRQYPPPPPPVPPSPPTPSPAASQSPPPLVSSAFTPKPTPEALQPEVDRAVQLGEALYRYERASAAATDLLFAENILPEDDRVLGWVTRPEGEGFRVDFIGEDPKRPQVLYAVLLTREAPPKLETFDPPRPLDAEGKALFLARQTALASNFRACKPTYSAVVLPAKLLGKPGWLVYLLAATRDGYEWVIGGHYRVLVSENGTKVLESVPLSKGCLSLRPESLPEDASSDTLPVPHALTPVPVETHVFTSLLYGEPLSVTTEKFTWRVDGARIDLLEER